MDSGAPKVFDGPKFFDEPCSLPSGRWGHREHEDHWIHEESYTQWEMHTAYMYTILTSVHQSGRDLSGKVNAPLTLPQSFNIYVRLGHRAVITPRHAAITAHDEVDMESFETRNSTISTLPTN